MESNDHPSINEELHTIITNLQLQQEVLTSQVSDILSQNEMLTQSLASIHEANVQSADLLDERLTALEDENRTLRELLINKPEVQSTFVAFLATPSGEPTYYANNGIVRFDNVTLNAGDAFNPSTSTFICPYTGYYSFSVSVSNAQYNTEHMRRIDGELWIDDVMTQKAIAGHAIPAPPDNWYSHQGSMTGVYLCSAGQSVNVRAGVSEDFSPAGVYSGPSSSFSGFLVSLVN